MDATYGGECMNKYNGMMDEAEGIISIVKLLIISNKVKD